ncbi:MAG: hypothetical protein JWP78_1076 [Mucilaginibacter sp.]|nr:hypothetical protein [Mucilaginibacter sp.]
MFMQLTTRLYLIDPYKKIYIHINQKKLRKNRDRVDFSSLLAPLHISYLKNILTRLFSILAPIGR